MFTEVWKSFFLENHKRFWGPTIILNNNITNVPLSIWLKQIKKSRVVFHYKFIIVLVSIFSSIPNLKVSQGNEKNIYKILKLKKQSNTGKSR